MVKVREHLDQLKELASEKDCMQDLLLAELTSLVQALDDEKNAPLAFIVDTACNSYSNGHVASDKMPEAIFELTERLCDAYDSGAVFSFENASVGLKALLFPEEVESENEVAPEPNPSPGNSLPETETSAPKTPEKQQDTLDVEEPAEPASEAALDGVETAIIECEEPDLLVEFLAEAREHLDSAEQLALILEDDAQDAEAINGLFRAIHSIKGSAGFLGLSQIGALSHCAESVLVLVRDKKLNLRGNNFDAVLLSLDFLALQIGLITDCVAQQQPLQVYVAPQLLIDCLERIIEQGSLSDELLEQMRTASKQVLAQQEAEDGRSEAASNTSSSSESMRVDGKRLEQLIDLIGELVITESGVQYELQRRGDLNSESLGARLRKVVREVQELSLSLKMVPVGNVLQKMNRMVRDLSAKLNKPCRLLIEGGDTEVDKTLLECIADPLVHLIRNSIDHGIEPAVEDRIKANKPETATVHVKAEHRGGNILLRIRDDGRGLNRDRILSRAIEKGSFQTQLN